MEEDVPGAGPSAAPGHGQGPRDLTQGPIARTLVAFAMPTLLANVLQSLNGSINAIWVGRFLGEGALAATANAHVIMFLIFASVFGIGMASTVLIGQAMGRRDIDAARRAFGTATGFSLILSVVAGAGGWFAAPAILHTLATPTEAFPLALTYLRVMCITIPSSILSVSVMMALRGAGDSVTPLRFMIVSVVLDILLNPALILGIGPLPALGIAGSALATVIAGTVSLTAMIIWVYWRDLPLRLRGPEWRYLLPDREMLGFILLKGLPMGIQMVIISAAGLIMSGLVNREGLITAAAYGATLQLWNYVQMPALAVSAAVSAMAAQNIGAGRWDRVGSINRAGIVTNLLMTGTLVTLILLFDRPVLALFLGSESPAIEVARHQQLLGSWSFLLFGVTMVLFGTMRANAVVIPPLIILGISMYPVRLAFYYTAYPLIGADAIWWSFPITSMASMLMAIAVYRWSKWRQASPALPMHLPKTMD
ncbi:MATE family efflux transporter [Sphingomonas lacunae]|uniref:MATE family efflux transporter n=1 Tax=Sphingomonas lacunae TaxID=2698828 RepID=A0A6M4B1Q4_9SPHN|nr:MATE family efflux transporter [Sphingomonas lacunae]QJQ33361.1 MATE family efflux transporter [Sphingomonas lacunae]